MALQRAFSSNKAVVFVSYFYVLGNTILALILQITKSFQVSLYAILPLPAREWQKLLWGLFSGHSKLETCVAHQCMVLLLLEPVTGSSPKPLLVESRLPGTFVGTFFFL